jgi:hypothetical protein
MLQTCVELHRVLKDTGSFYYHCDWHASLPHVKVMLDKLFGENQFQNEAIDFNAEIHVEGVIVRLYDDIHKGALEFYGLVVDKLVVIGDLDELEW